MSSDIQSCIIWFDDSISEQYTNYIRVTRFTDDGEPDGGCWSYVGHTTNLDQQLNLGPNCLSVGTVQERAQNPKKMF